MGAEMRIWFAGNKGVHAEFGGFTIATDQPVSGGGDGRAPAPFDLFLASLGTCAGIFVLGFCQKRGIPTEGIDLVQKMDWDETRHLVTRVRLEIRLPGDFPEKYRESLVRAAELCTVKRHLQTPPAFEVTAVDSGSREASA